MAQELCHVTASCLCGTARYEFPLLRAQVPVQAAFCHCNSCRHMSGCLCVSSIPIASEGSYRPPDSLLNRLQRFEFSKNQIYHYFCPVCGSHMVANVLPRAQNKFQGRWFVMCGTILGDDASRLYMPTHEYIADTVDGGLADLFTAVRGVSIARWDYHPGNGPQRPLDASHNAASSIPLKEDSLRSHCKCRRVDFKISRPVSQEKYSVRFCSCRFCRSSTGMDGRAVAFALVPATEIPFANSNPCDEAWMSKMMRGYTSGSSQTRWFCGCCGATAFVTAQDSTTIFVAVGLFAAPEGARAESWLDWGAWSEQMVRDDQCVLYR